MEKFTEVGVPIYEMPTVLPEIIPIDWIEDWEQRLARQDAFWENEIIDRPVVRIVFRKENQEYPAPTEKEFASHRDRWMDCEYSAEMALYNLMNTAWLGDALPGMCPNLGPEVFSAFFGMEMEFGEGTSWSIPLIEDWAEVDKVKFSVDNFYWQKLEEYTDTLIEIGKGKFYTGYTDLHPGGDCITAFRDPLNLNIDMIEAVDEVKSLLKYTDQVFIDVFNYSMDKLQANRQAITSWPGIVSSKRWHVPSNDFSCMISKEMFDDVFLPGITAECDNAEASVYHLDGPQALQHLDSLLAIDSLNVIQWVYGAGNGRTTDWLEVYQKCQAAGKGIQLNSAPDELDTIMATLRPEGVWLGISGVDNREDAEAVIKKIEKWK